VKSRQYTLASPDVDIFALHGEIEVFCERHMLPKQSAHDLQLLTEELILCFMSDLREGRAFELTVEYLEAKRTLGATLLLPAGVDNPFAENATEDPEQELSVALIRNLAPGIEEIETPAGRRIDFALRSI
jgi:polar amino acid transport system ATP-binding protein